MTAFTRDRFGKNLNPRRDDSVPPLTLTTTTTTATGSSCVTTPYASTSTSVGFGPAVGLGADPTNHNSTDWYNALLLSQTQQWFPPGLSSSIPKFTSHSPSLPTPTQHPSLRYSSFTPTSTLEHLPQKGQEGIQNDPSDQSNLVGLDMDLETDEDAEGELDLDLDVQIEVEERPRLNLGKAYAKDFANGSKDGNGRGGEDSTFGVIVGGYMRVDADEEMDVVGDLEAGAGSPSVAQPQLDEDPASVLTVVGKGRDRRKEKGKGKPGGKRAKGVMAQKKAKNSEKEKEGEGSQDDAGDKKKKSGAKRRDKGKGKEKIVEFGEGGGGLMEVDCEGDRVKEVKKGRKRKSAVGTEDERAQRKKRKARVAPNEVEAGMEEDDWGGEMMEAGVDGGFMIEDEDIYDDEREQVKRKKKKSAGNVTCSIPSLCSLYTESLLNVLVQPKPSSVPQGKTTWTVPKGLHQNLPSADNIPGQVTGPANDKVEKFKDPTLSGSSRELGSRAENHSYLPKPNVWTSSKIELTSVLPELTGSKCYNGVAEGSSNFPMVLLEDGQPIRVCVGYDCGSAAGLGVGDGRDIENPVGSITEERMRVTLTMIRDFVCSVDDFRLDQNQSIALESIQKLVTKTDSTCPTLIPPTGQDNHDQNDALLAHDIASVNLQGDKESNDADQSMGGAEEEEDVLVYIDEHPVPPFDSQELGALPDSIHANLNADLNIPQPNASIITADDRNNPPALPPIFSPPPAPITAPTSIPIPKPVPEEIAILTTSQTHNSPITLISSRASFICHWLRDSYQNADSGDSDKILPDEIEYLFLGFFNIEGCTGRVVSVTEVKEGVKAANSGRKGRVGKRRGQKKEQEQEIEEKEWLVMGRAEWVFELVWQGSGMPWWIVADEDDKRNKGERGKGKKREGESHVGSSFPSAPSHFTTHEATAATSAISSASSRLQLNILPLQLTEGQEEGSSDEAMPRGWLCSRCGKLNQRVMLRHRWCGSSWCWDNPPGEGYAVELESAREPRQMQTLSVLPYNVVPVWMESWVVDWDDGMRTIGYWPTGRQQRPPVPGGNAGSDSEMLQTQSISKSQSKKGKGKAKERREEGGTQMMVKHVFTCNHPELQVEAANLFVRVQKEVILMKKVGDPSECIDDISILTVSNMVVRLKDPFFRCHVLPANALKVGMRRPKEESFSKLTWEDDPKVLRDAWEFMEFYAKSYAEVEVGGGRQEEGLQMGKLSVFGWVSSGKRKHPEVIDAREGCVVVACLGNDVVLTIVPKGVIAPPKPPEPVLPPLPRPVLDGMIPMEREEIVGEMVSSTGASNPASLGIEAGSGPSSLSSLSQPSSSLPLPFKNGTNWMVGGGGHLKGVSMIGERGVVNAASMGLESGSRDGSEPGVSGVGQPESGEKRGNGKGKGKEKDKDTEEEKVKAGGEVSGGGDWEKTEMVITLVHGDVLVLCGGQYEYAVKRLGTSISQG
ncbi:hypothetical protein AMATHDRAFT_51138 [Amanita thiersii Skay4041]|uniref:Uncharacterized protein n=1 Tax=Amanita thiersii Skay4041 TaxID=703135 RepID=A0A2A9N8U0_9AGAR|nr:hypothetical protein AMATHDRAFT_51138 [Amanita thiersii Skay4041]